MSRRCTSSVYRSSLSARTGSIISTSTTPRTTHSTKSIHRNSRRTLPPGPPWPISPLNQIWISESLPMPNIKHPIFRADQVGSLVRPASVVAAREEFDAGKIDAAKLRDAEDAGIRAAVAKQEEIGLPVVTDGEFRRGTYSDSFTTGGIDGISVELTEEQG